MAYHIQAIMNKIYSVPEQEFKDLVSQSFTYSEILVKLELCSNGGTSSKLLKKRIKELELSVDHFKSRNEYAKKQSLETILCENSSYSNISRLKIRLVNEGYLKYKCVSCDNTGEWNGKPLSLQLDHVNGINDDNRIENLRFLCPNCHSQTETYAGKNKTTYD